MENKLENDRLISSHRNKSDYQESPENSLQFAYQHRRFDKFTLELARASDVLKTKVLTELNEDVRQADKINLMLLSSDILTVLISLLQNPDDTIRELTSSILIYICKMAMGKQYIIENTYIHDINVLIDDKVPQIRMNTYLALLNFCEFREGVDHYFLAELESTIIDKFSDELEVDVLILALRFFKLIMEAHASKRVIERPDCIRKLQTLLSHKNTQVKELAALNLASISFIDEGKVQIIKQNCVLNLCKCLEDPELEVKIAASLALASLAQKNEGKQLILDYSYFAKIMELLSEPSEQLKLNVIQLIASVAEHPMGRKKAHACLDRLKSYLENPELSYLEPYVKKTIEVIQWQP